LKQIACAEHTARGIERMIRDSLAALQRLRLSDRDTFQTSRVRMRFPQDKDEKVSAFLPSSDHSLPLQRLPRPMWRKPRPIILFVRP
jgi:hypothetical protein